MRQCYFVYIHAYSGKIFVTPIKTKWSESSVSIIYTNIISSVPDVIFTGCF